MAEPFDLRAAYSAGQLVCSIEAAGRALHLSRGTAYQLARTGTLPGARRIGSRWLCSIPELLEWLGAPLETDKEDAPTT